MSGLVRGEEITIRIIHCADLHLDPALTSYSSEEKRKSVRSGLLNNFVKMADYAEMNGVSAILISGDLFDRRRISGSVKMTVKGTIEDHPDIIFFCLAGNHDPDIADLMGDDLPENLQLFPGRDRWTSYEIDGITVTGAVLSEGGSASVYDSLFLNPEKFNIVMLHGQTAEYPVKGAAVIGMQRLKGINIDYLALGHVHSHRTGKLDARGIWCYPGCLEGRGFDECGNHGFEVLDIDSGTRNFRMKFVPFAGRTVYEVLADVTGCDTTLQMAERIKESLSKIPEDSGAGHRLGGDVSPEKDMAEDVLKENIGADADGQNGAASDRAWFMTGETASCGMRTAAPGESDDGYRLYDVAPSEKDMVKVILTGDLEVDAEKDTDFLERMFENDYFIFRVEDKTGTKIDFEKYIKDASLKGEFVRLVMADDTIGDSKKAEIIRCGIRALAGEDFLG